MDKIYCISRAELIITKYVSNISKNKKKYILTKKYIHLFIDNTRRALLQMIVHPGTPWLLEEQYYILRSTDRCHVMCFDPLQSISIIMTLSVIPYPVILHAVAWRKFGVILTWKGSTEWLQPLTRKNYSFYKLSYEFNPRNFEWKGFLITRKKCCSEELVLIQI